jgi:hypothetical protein
MLKDIQGKGFHLTFKNGLTISVQFGYGNYCDNRMKSINNPINLFSHKLSSQNAEIGIWDKEQNWITNTFIDCNGDGVKGYLSADEIADLIFRVKNYKE